MKFFIRLFLFSLLLIPTVAYNQTASLLPNAVQQFFDNNGNPLSVGTVDTYVAGTSTRKTTWKNSGETITNTNPIILDAGGKAIIYGEGTYRQVVKDRNGNIIWDAVTTPASGGGAGGGTATTLPVGWVTAYSGITAPSLYQFAYGQEVIRANFPDLFTALTITQNVGCTNTSTTITGLTDTTQISIGGIVELSCVAPGTTVVSKTTSTVVLSNPSNVSLSASAVFFLYGNGNGSTTFNLPDLRGRVIAGRNNMGGTASTTLTSSFFGTNPNATGATGGDQSSTITNPNLPPYTPTGTISTITPAGSIVSTDSGHTHGFAANLVINSGALTVSPTASGVFGFNNTSLNVTQSGTANITSTFTGTPVTPVFTGIIAGGTSSPLFNIPPTMTLNYIIKVLPGPDAIIISGIDSIQGMVGVLLCGNGMICNSQTLNVDTGTSGHKISFLDGANTWSALQTFDGGANIAGTALIYPASGQATLQLGIPNPSTPINAYIDFHSDVANTGFGVRLIAHDSGSASGSGILDTQGTLNILTVTNTLQQGLLVTQTGFGTISPPGDYFYNYVNILDGINAPPPGGAAGVYGFKVAINTGDGQGSRGALFGEVTRILPDSGASAGDDIGIVGNAVSSIDDYGSTPNVITASSWAATGGGQVTFTTTTSHGLTTGSRFYVINESPSGYNGTYTAIAGTGGSTLIAAKASNPGASTVQGTLYYRGTLFGAAFGATAKSGATNYSEVAGAEVDVGINTGGSAHSLLGWSVVKNGQLSGIDYDAAYEVGATNPTGWRTALLLAGFHGQPALASTGCVICTDGNSQTIATGIDLFAYTITGNFLRGPGATSFITGAGALGTITATFGTTGGSVTPLTLNSNGSGSAVFRMQAAMGSADYTMPTGTGTMVIGATGLLSVNAATGIVSCATCLAGTPSALTKVDDTNVTLTLGGTPATTLLQATSLTLGWTGQLGLTRGGTAASLVASNGGIVYSTASALAILNGTATANLPLLSGSSTTPAWAAISYPTSATSGGIPYFSSTSVMGTSALLSAHQLMIGGGAGSPPVTLGSVGTANQVLHGSASVDPSWSAVVSADMNITTTSCTNQFVTAISSGGVGTCTTDTLASAQHANQGTTTTVLHGNAAGNPLFAAVSISADVSGLGTGVATFLGTPSSANLAAALTDETGSGLAVFGTSPILSTVDARGTWTTGTSWTLPALTLSGIVSGAGNQINNVIIGTSTPLAGFFTTLSATSTASFAGSTTINSSGFLGVGTSSIATLFANYTPVNIAGASGASINLLAGSTSEGRIIADSSNLYFVSSGSTGIYFGLGASGIGTSMMTITSAGLLVTGGQFFVASMTQTSAAQSGTVCYNVGSSAVTYDATLGCLASFRAAKNIGPELDPNECLQTVLKLHTVAFTRKPGFGGESDPAEQIGFIAEDVDAIDSRLTARRPDGTLGGVRYAQNSAIYACAIKSMKADNDNLRQEIENLKHIIGVK